MAGNRKTEVIKRERMRKRNRGKCEADWKLERRWDTVREMGVRYRRYGGRWERGSKEGDYEENERK